MHMSNESTENSIAHQPPQTVAEEVNTGKKRGEHSMANNHVNGKSVAQSENPAAIRIKNSEEEKCGKKELEAREVLNLSLATDATRVIMEAINCAIDGLKIDGKCEVSIWIGDVQTLKIVAKNDETGVKISIFNGGEKGDGIGSLVCSFRCLIKNQSNDSEKNKNDSEKNNSEILKGIIPNMGVIMHIILKSVELAKFSHSAVEIREKKEGDQSKTLRTWNSDQVNSSGGNFNENHSVESPTEPSDLEKKHSHSKKNSSDEKTSAKDSGKAKEGGRKTAKKESTKEEIFAKTKKSDKSPANEKSEEAGGAKKPGADKMKKHEKGDDGKRFEEKKSAKSETERPAEPVAEEPAEKNAEPSNQHKGEKNAVKIKVSQSKTLNNHEDKISGESLLNR
jgi:hypothetical protein